VADRAEETCDCIELIVELERDHVTAMKDDVRMFLPGDLEHSIVDI